MIGAGSMILLWRSSGIRLSDRLLGIELLGPEESKLTGVLEMGLDLVSKSVIAASGLFCKFRILSLTVCDAGIWICRRNICL